jgi:hypothetical protein
MRAISTLEGGWNGKPAVKEIGQSFRKIFTKDQKRNGTFLLRVILCKFCCLSVSFKFICRIPNSLFMRGDIINGVEESDFQPLFYILASCMTSCMSLKLSRLQSYR